MNKTRVIDLASELGVSPEDLIRTASELSILIQTSRSTLNAEEIEKLKAAFQSEKPATPKDERRVRSTVIRRRRKPRASATETPEPEVAAEAVAAPEPPKPTAVEEKAEKKPKEAKAKKEDIFPTFASEKEALDEISEGKPVRRITKPEPAKEEPKEEPKKEEAVEQDAAAPEETTEKAPKSFTSSEFMPKTFTIDEVIPGYSEMVLEQKRVEEEAAKPQSGKEKAVNNEDLEAFKEAFGKAKKRKGKGKERQSESFQIRRGVVVENFRTRGPRRRKKKIERAPSNSSTVEAKASKRIVRIDNDISVSELAAQLSIKAGLLIKQLMSQDMMVGLNDRLDKETAELIADEFGFRLENVEFNIDDLLPKFDRDAKALNARPPVITIMGHVDHGKTSLLDKIRSNKKDIAAGEAGGITQHIGAYVVQSDSGQDLVFIDTPGHEAFTAMRARGAQVTDLVVLVVAADDGAKPQTIEAINHAKAAEVPLIVAVNKVDKEEARPERVRQELTEHGLIPDNWGGDTSFVDVSAKTGKGLDDLLEILALQAELLELKAIDDCPARGVVIESKLDKGRGPLATVIVHEGTLSQSHIVVSGGAFGRVRSLLGDDGLPLAKAGPGFPAEIVGWNGVPPAGQAFYAVNDEKSARAIADALALKEKQLNETKNLAGAPRSLEDISAMLQTGDVKELAIVLKGDVQGSIEAIRAAIEKIKHPEIEVKILHTAVGGITESDVQLASISNGIVFGFNVRADNQAKQLAESEGVGIKTYTIIYELLDDIKDALEGLLDPKFEENLIGTATIRETFQITKVGTIAGMIVNTGKLTRGAVIRLFRNDVKIYEGSMSTLKRFKDDAKEVTHGYECGGTLENFQDLKVGDVLEAYERVEVKAKLEHKLISS